MQEKWGRLTDDWITIEDIIIYCFGPATEVIFDKISADIKVKFIIDNNPCWHGKEYYGIPIYSFTECKDLIQETKIVVSAEAISSVEVARSLEAEGYVQNKDFTLLERFVSEWYFKKFHSTNILELHTSITTRCTFNCKYCNVFIPYHKIRKDYSFNEIKQNIDLLFENVDYVFKYQLIGGEPLLHKDLAKILDYLSENYREKIGTIRVVTNGGIVPDKQLVEALKLSECYVLVSNYTHSISYKERYEETIKTLRNNNIRFRELVEQRWRDTGFPLSPPRFEKNQIRNHMLICSTFWHGLVDKKIYYCNCTWSAQEAGLYRPEDTDYLSLEHLGKDEEEKKKSILKFVLGDWSLDYYNSFCGLCGGCGIDNKNFVKAGEQINEN